MPQKHKHSSLNDICVSLPSPPPPLRDARGRRNWTRTLNQSPGRGVLRYQAFHMTVLTEFLCSSSSWQYKEWADGALPRLEAILWPSSVLNIVTNGKPWRTLGGITQKQKFATAREREGGVYRCTLATNVVRFQNAYFSARTFVFRCEKKTARSQIW